MTSVFRLPSWALPPPVIPCEVMAKEFTPYDVQKNKLEKLMANIDKPVHIPESRSTERKFPDAPEFVRNVMGSSAGAGSGEFHVYRHLRRKEYARQKFIEEQARREELDSQFQERLESKKREADEKTEKKRLKRLKKKQKAKDKRKKGAVNESKTGDEEEDDEDEVSEEQPRSKMVKEEPTNEPISNDGDT